MGFPLLLSFGLALYLSSAFSLFRIIRTDNLVRSAAFDLADAACLGIPLINTFILVTLLLCIKEETLERSKNKSRETTTL
jgi:hypothetical protein